MGWKPQAEQTLWDWGLNLLPPFPSYPFQKYASWSPLFAGLHISHWNRKVIKQKPSKCWLAGSQRLVHIALFLQWTGKHTCSSNALSKTTCKFKFSAFALYFSKKFERCFSKSVPSMEWIYVSKTVNLCVTKAPAGALRLRYWLGITSRVPRNFWSNLLLRVSDLKTLLQSYRYWPNLGACPSAQK